MSSIILSKKKSKKFLSIVYENKDNKQSKQFVRSYSQLLNKHFNQSMKQKSQLRKRQVSSSLGKRQIVTAQGKRQISTSQGFRTKKNRKFNIKQQNNYDQILSNRSHKSNKQFNRLTARQSLEFANNQEQLDTSIIQDSINPQQINFKNKNLKNLELIKNQSKNNQTRRKLQLNPQTNEKMDQFILTKTQLLQKQTHQNVFINKRLHENNEQKRNLMKQIQTLKMDILRQKKTKSKISTDMGKLMNKIQSTNNYIHKTLQQRFYIKQQTKFLQKEYQRQYRKNQQLHNISNINQQKINIENQMINELNKTLQRNKASFFQLKTLLNQLKQIYMRETKCLTKTQIIHNQTKNQRDLLCKAVDQSYTNVKLKDKLY